MTDKQNRDVARETFRQFAWNLAGTLADRKGPKPRPGSGGTKRG